MARADSLASLSDTQPLPAVLTGKNGAYRIAAEHARGGFGVTFRACRVADGLDVIVKYLPLAGLGDWKTFELFEREANTLRTLSHPSIPTWIDSFAIGGDQTPRGFALVQQLIAGRTLGELLRAQEALSPDQMLDWFTQLLEVLAYLHERSPPVIHRDITPKNVILQGDGRAVLVDFGSVQAALRSANTISSTSAGTFGYAPLEQFVGRATPASDLYGLGMTFLALASGREPEDMPVDGVRVDVRALWNGDARLQLLLHEMTEVDPRYRLADAREALARVAAVRGISPPGALVPVATTPVSVPRPPHDPSTVSDGDSYAIHLASRLPDERFSFEAGCVVASTPAVLIAERATRHLEPAVRMVVVRAERLCGADRRVPLDTTAFQRFVNAIQDNERKVRAGGRAAERMVVPVVVANGPIPPGWRSAVGGTTEKVWATVVDLAHGTVEVMQPAAAEVPLAPYLEWLLTPSRLGREATAPSTAVAKEQLFSGWARAIFAANGVISLGAAALVWIFGGAPELGGRERLFGGFAVGGFVFAVLLALEAVGVFGLRVLNWLSGEPPEGGPLDQD